MEDDGPGIAPEARERALAWGGRLDVAPAGSGFGLSIVAEQVRELYSGALRLEDSPWAGFGRWSLCLSSCEQAGESLRRGAEGLAFGGLHASSRGAAIRPNRRCMRSTIKCSGGENIRRRLKH